MSWSCIQVEERLSAYLDGALPEAEQREFREHVDACARCAPLLAQVTHVIGRLRTLQAEELPSRMVRNILDQTVGLPKSKRDWLAWLPILWNPRFAMGVAVVLATFFIIFPAIGLQKSNSGLAVLNPVNIFQAADRHAHLAFARSVKFVNDLRVVYEIQSRLQPASAAPPAEQESAPSQSQPQPKSQRDSQQDHSSNGRSSLFATFLLDAPGRSPR